MERSSQKFGVEIKSKHSDGSICLFKSEQKAIHDLMRQISFIYPKQTSKENSNV